MLDKDKDIMRIVIAMEPSTSMICYHSTNQIWMALIDRNRSINNLVTKRLRNILMKSLSQGMKTKGSFLVLKAFNVSENCLYYGKLSMPLNVILNKVNDHLDLFDFSLLTFWLLKSLRLRLFAFLWEGAHSTLDSNLNSHLAVLGSILSFGISKKYLF